MTYKKIVQRLAEDEARAFLENALNENNIPYQWVFLEDSSLEMDKDAGVVYWEARFSIILKDHAGTIVTVGGTADDLVGVCASVIWKGDRQNIVWMAVKKTRESLGIKEMSL